jgi:hypothetical protein
VNAQRQACVRSGAFELEELNERRRIDVGLG